MSTRSSVMPDASHAYVDARRSRIANALKRDLQPVGSGSESLAADRLASFRSEAEALYWNELTWEQLTDEEAIGGGHMTELVFAGFLAFVDGLLVDRVPSDALAPARPHPDAVEEILRFLAERYGVTTAQLEGGADSQKLVWARAMTSQLIDLVLFRLYRVGSSEQELIDRVS